MSGSLAIWVRFSKRYSLVRHSQVTFGNRFRRKGTEWNHTLHRYRIVAPSIHTPDCTIPKERVARPLAVFLLMGLKDAFSNGSRRTVVPEPEPQPQPEDKKLAITAALGFDQ